MKLMQVFEIIKVARTQTQRIYLQVWMRITMAKSKKGRLISVQKVNNLEIKDDTTRLSKDYDFPFNSFMYFLAASELTNVTDDSQKNATNFKHSNATKTMDISNSGISQLNHLRTSISCLV